MLRCFTGNRLSFTSSVEVYVSLRATEIIQQIDALNLDKASLDSLQLCPLPTSHPLATAPFHSARLAPSGFTPPSHCVCVLSPILPDPRPAFSPLLTTAWGSGGVVGWNGARSCWDWSPESPSAVLAASGSSSPASLHSLHAQSTFTTLPYGSLSSRHPSPK